MDGMVSPHKHTFRAAKLLTSLCVGTLVADDGEDSDSSDTRTYSGGGLWVGCVDAAVVDAAARPKLPASSSRQSLNASAHRRPAATASHGAWVLVSAMSWARVELTVWCFWLCRHLVQPISRNGLVALTHSPMPLRYGR